MSVELLRGGTGNLFARIKLPNVQTFVYELPFKEFLFLVTKQTNWISLVGLQDQYV